MGVCGSTWATHPAPAPPARCSARAAGARRTAPTWWWRARERTAGRTPKTSWPVLRSFPPPKSHPRARWPRRWTSARCSPAAPPWRWWTISRTATRPAAAPRAMAGRRGAAAAGIDVISTVSVGDLDSLADVVAKITGAAPRQTCPIRSSARRARSSWWTWRRRPCGTGWPAATSTRRTRRRRRWAAGSRRGTCRRCASWPCGGWPPRWPAARGGTSAVAAIPAAVRPGSGWWSRSAVARRARC